MMVFVVVMIGMMMRIGVFVIALAPPEHQKVHAHAVKGRGDHAQERSPERQPGHGLRAGMQRQDDAVLGIEARKQRHADQRQRARQRCPVRNGHVFAQAAHVAHVLIVVHGHDDRPCRQKQQGLEKGVREQVKQRHGISRRPQPHDHIPQLRQGGVGHHPLDVVLDQAHQAHQEGRGRANDKNHVERHVTQLEQGRHARDHEDARRHHGGRVNQRRTGRGAEHGIGQPHVQRHLRRFAHGADEQANG